MSDPAPKPAAAPVPANRPPLWRQRFIGDTAYLERCVRQFFVARDVMEELRVFDERQDAAEARRILDADFLPVAGISRQGRVHACCRAADLGEGACASFARPIAPEMTVNEDAPLLQVIVQLGEQEHLLVRGVAGYTGCIAHSDLQKPPARMLFFAIVSIVELRWQQWIREHFGAGDAWHACLSPARLEMARGLMEERNRNGWSLALVDCLQFSDRAVIVLKTPELWEKTLFTSKGQARDRIRAIQRLRDDLAHSQDLLMEDWETILELARWLGPAFRQLKARNPV